MLIAIQVAKLSHENHKLTEERHDIRTELDIARSKLEKIKMSKSALHDQLKGLGEMVRI